MLGSSYGSLLFSIINRSAYMERFFGIVTAVIFLFPLVGIRVVLLLGWIPLLALRLRSEQNWNSLVCIFGSFLLDRDFKGIRRGIDLA